MAEEFKGKHVVIFSRSCLFLSSEERQQEMNDEIESLSKNGNFELHFTSHRNPTREMLRAIPKGRFITATSKVYVGIGPLVVRATSASVEAILPQSWSIRLV